MPRYLLLCIQIICFCLAWAFITFQIEPFSRVWSFFSGADNSTTPEWAVHTNYLFTIILLITGISATIRLKLIAHFNSVAITFLAVLWACFALQPDQYFAYLLKYSYIVLIPVVFHKIFTQNIRHIELFIKATIQISLVYFPYNLGLFLIHETNLSQPLILATTSTFTLLSVGASLGLYITQYFNPALKVAALLFTIGLLIDVLPVLKNPSGFDFNQIPMAIIGSSLIVFTNWVKALNNSEA